MSYTIHSGTNSHRRALGGVVELTTESLVSANIIDTFRNVLPNISAFVKDVVLEFKVRDETDFKINKTDRDFVEVREKLKDLNFVRAGSTLVQTPEGFKGHYVQYMEWLNKQGFDYITEATEALGAYYRDLSVFISSRDAKLSLKDKTRMYADMQKGLDNVKDGLGSFFDPRTANALRTLDSVFDRGPDISTTIKLAVDLNRKRLTIKTKEIASLTQQIAGLINMLVESSQTDKIPEVSGEAAKGISQGALVIAHYVEFIGVLLYRMEEAISAVSIMAEQVSKIE